MKFFLLKVGNGWEGDIAIDDISFNDGECPLTNTCDFESIDLCGYTNEIDNSFTWDRVLGTASLPDHSYETNIGHYMQVKSVQPHRGIYLLF